MNEVSEKISRIAVDKNQDGDFCDRDQLRELRNEIDQRRSGMFVIEQVRTIEKSTRLVDGRRYFWNCSTEHGCGWNPGQPKQAFSKSELSREIFNMIDRGYFCPIIIRELYL